MQSVMLDEEAVRSIVRDLVEETEVKILKAIHENRPNPEARPMTPTLKRRHTIPDRLTFGQTSNLLSTYGLKRVLN